MLEASPERPGTGENRNGGTLSLPSLGWEADSRCLSLFYASLGRIPCPEQSRLYEVQEPAVSGRIGASVAEQAPPRARSLGNSFFRS
jgi:hypothetical protein